MNLKGNNFYHNLNITLIQEINQMMKSQHMN